MLPESWEGVNSCYLCANRGAYLVTLGLSFSSPSLKPMSITINMNVTSAYLSSINSHTSFNSSLSLNDSSSISSNSSPYFFFKLFSNLVTAFREVTSPIGWFCEPSVIPQREIARTHLDEIAQKEGQFLDLVLGRRVWKAEFAQHAGEEFTVVLYRRALA
jgi:hypothetical protein